MNRYVIKEGMIVNGMPVKWDRTYSLDLPVAMTQKELIKKSDQCAKVIEDQGQIHTEFQNVFKHYSKEMNRLTKEIRRLQKLIMSGQEFKTVDVADWFDWEIMGVETYRLDTGAKIASREMTDAERQIDIEDAITAKKG